MPIRLHSHTVSKDDIQVQRQHRGRLSLQGYRILKVIYACKLESACEQELIEASNISAEAGDRY